MVFYPPPWVPKLPFDPPDSITIPEFMFDEQYHRRPLNDSVPPFVCGLSNKSFSASEYKQRVEDLAKGLSKATGWSPNSGSEWSKVVGIFSVNTIDYLGACWAALRLGGICTPANAAYSFTEVVHQMKSSGAKCIFTCASLLEMTLKVAKECGIPRDQIFLLELPEQLMEGKATPNGFKTVDQLIDFGKSSGDLEKVKFEKGQGAKQTAFLCFSSGTSGLPKGVMISHRNIIANALMNKTYELLGREQLQKRRGMSTYRDVALGLLPFNHIYALVVICHSSTYRGDTVVVLPKFEPQTFLESIQKQRITTLYIVPPIVIFIINNKKLCDQYNLDSLDSLYTGAAPLGVETAKKVQEMWPSVLIRQAYGMTESATLTTATSVHDIMFGSSGSLISGVEARLVTSEGNEITGYDQPGELLIKSPSVVLGYMNNEKETRETFQDGWLRTGDEAVVKKSENGYEHVWIVDRLKELIKVKGLQVAPAELEAHLLTHPDVADCTVIPVPNERAGEVPKAFVVKAPEAANKNEAQLINEIKKHVEAHKSRHKWLEGGVEFIDAIPKSPSGKILRRMLRDKEKETRRKQGAKI